MVFNIWRWMTYCDSFHLSFQHYIHSARSLFPRSEAFLIDSSQSHNSQLDWGPCLTRGLHINILKSPLVLEYVFKVGSIFDKVKNIFTVLKEEIQNLYCVYDLLLFFLQSESPFSVTVSSPSTHVCMYVCSCCWRGQRINQVPQTGSPIEIWSSPSWLDWLPKEPKRSIRLSPFSVYGHTPLFKSVSWGSNSGPYEWVAVTLLEEPSP